MLLADGLLSPASNNLNRQGYVVSNEPRGDRADTQKKNHEQACFEGLNSLEQTGKDDSQRTKRPNTHCNMPFSPTLEGLDEAYTFCRFQLALIAGEVILMLKGRIA